jgi:glutamate synthase domain-containing protein 2
MNIYLEKIAAINFGSVKNTFKVVTGKNVNEARQTATESGKLLRRALEKMHADNAEVNNILKNKGTPEEFNEANKYYTRSMDRASRVNKKFKADTENINTQKALTSKYRKNTAIGAASTMATGGLSYGVISTRKESPPKFKVD